jgi:hypothetical protein
MLSWLNRTTLDIIGLAGFGYEFNSLADSEPTELNRALSTLFTSGAGLFAALQSMIPPLRLVVRYEQGRSTSCISHMPPNSLRLERDVLTKLKPS